MSTPEDSSSLSERFGASYWQDTHYGRLGEYGQALERTMRWYRGLLRLVDGVLPREGRHVDVGCGHGAMVHLMLRRGLDAHGFDASDWMMKQAREAGPGLEERFRVGDAAEDIPFEGSFDVITCLEVVEHLEAPERALALIKQRLAPGGTAVLTTPNPENFMPFRNPATNDPTHVSVHVPAWWRTALADAGLAVVDDSTYLALPFVWRIAPPLSHWFRFRSDRAPGWFAVCRHAEPAA